MRNISLDKDLLLIAGFKYSACVVGVCWKEDLDLRRLPRTYAPAKIDGTSCMRVVRKSKFKYFWYENALVRKNLRKFTRLGNFFIPFRELHRQGIAFT